jgi:hypothetical protein
MSRPDPIQYAERLYAAIVAANFSTMSFLAFGNAVKDGVALRRIPRIAAEPFMRVVGEMLEFEFEDEVVNVAPVARDAIAPHSAVLGDIISPDESMPSGDSRRPIGETPGGLAEESDSKPVGPLI